MNSFLLFKTISDPLYTTAALDKISWSPSLRVVDAVDGFTDGILHTLWFAASLIYMSISPFILDFLQPDLPLRWTYTQRRRWGLMMCQVNLKPRLPQTALILSCRKEKAWGLGSRSVIQIQIGAVVCCDSVELCSSERSSQVSRNSGAKKYLTENLKISRHLILCECRVFYDSFKFWGPAK